MQAVSSNSFFNRDLVNNSNNKPNPMKNGDYTFSVVTPPNNLPRVSLHDEICGDKYVPSQDLPPLEPVREQGQKNPPGSFSMKMSFVASMLACLSLLPFIRKR